MPAQYLKIARRLLYSRINARVGIIGLAIGIVATGLVFLWIGNGLKSSTYFPEHAKLCKVREAEDQAGKAYVTIGVWVLKPH